MIEPPDSGHNSGLKNVPLSTGSLLSRCFNRLISSACRGGGSASLPGAAGLIVGRNGADGDMAFDVDL